MDSESFSRFHPDSSEWDDPIAWNPLEEEDYPDFSQVAPLDLQIMEDLGARVRAAIPDGMPTDLVPLQTVHGMEVGDDRLDFSRSVPVLAAGLVFQQEVFGMKTSESDTYISKDIWNFCEVSGALPTDISQSFHVCRKSGNFHDLGFTDVPPLRIILDVMKGDRSHSSTIPGKAAMLGARMRTPRTEHRFGLHLASFIQDGNLRSSMSTEPKYLPQIMGGSGVQALFDNVKNVYISTYAYRGGICQRVYGTACRELQECLTSLERGEAFMPVLCSRLRDKQEYLHGTYANQVLIPPTYLKDISRNPEVRPILLASSGSNRFACFENRMLRTRTLVTRSEAERSMEYYTRIERQVLSHQKVEITDAAIKLQRARSRAEYGNAITCNVAFANLLKRQATLKDVQALIGQKFLPVGTGVTHFTMWDAQFLFDGGRSEHYSIEDLSTCEDLFVRSEVSEEETYKIGHLILHPTIGNTTRRVETTTKVGLYQINQSMEQWSEDILQKLQEQRIGNQPVPYFTALSVFEQKPEWVNDDTLLIARCLRDTEGRNYRSSSVILVSDDRRLGNQMANTCNVYVIRVPSLEFIRWMKYRDLEPQSQSGWGLELLSHTIDRRGRRDEIVSSYVDTGSLAAAMSKLDTCDDPGQDGKIFRRVLTETGTREGHRFCSYSLQRLEGKQHVQSEIHRPVRLPKRFRYGNFPEGRQPRTPSGSWRSGHSVTDSNK